jgi:SpoVK/Ycf46/Vps4 family AAA+-type ATPase
VVWDFPLPDKKDLNQAIDHIRIDAELGVIENQDIIAEAALGLTASEAEDSFALSIVESKGLDAEVVSREKAGALLRQAKIEMSTFNERFDGLGGLDIIKDYTLSAAKSPMSLGILLLGPPGTGKSHFAKALGNELGIPTLSLDFSKMMSSLVGSSESNIRAALQAVDAMGHTVVFIDEMEKGLSGVQSSGNLDSGVKAGVGSTFLQWTSNRKPGLSYLVATCNDISALPPEYTRSGRFDAIFWLDLPNTEERDAIWGIYEKKFKVSGPHPDDKDWTGAEIFSCCRTALMLNCSLQTAGEYIIPMAKTMTEKIQSLRDWAKGRAVPASKAAIAVSGRRITNK